MDRDVFDFKNDLAIRLAARGDEIFDDFLLAIDGDAAAAGELEHIDAMAATIEAKFETVVDEAFASHAFANTGFVEQINRALFENAGTDTFFDVVAATGFHDDRLDSLKMQKVRKKKARGACADDSDLRAHRGQEFSAKRRPPPTFWE